PVAADEILEIPLISGTAEFTADSRERVRKGDAIDRSVVKAGIDGNHDGLVEPGGPLEADGAVEFSLGPQLVGEAEGSGRAGSPQPLVDGYAGRLDDKYAGGGVAGVLDAAGEIDALGPRAPLHGDVHDIAALLDRAFDLFDAVGEFLVCYGAVAGHE